MSGRRKRILYLVLAAPGTTVHGPLQRKLELTRLASADKSAAFFDERMQQPAVDITTYAEHFRVRESGQWEATVLLVQLRAEPRKITEDAEYVLRLCKEFNAQSAGDLFTSVCRFREFNLRRRANLRGHSFLSDDQSLSNTSDAGTH